jgi:hypothetical protein
MLELKPITDHIFMTMSAHVLAHWDFLFLSVGMHLLVGDLIAKRKVMVMPDINPFHVWVWLGHAPVI